MNNNKFEYQILYCMVSNGAVTVSDLETESETDYTSVSCFSDGFFGASQQLVKKNTTSQVW